MPEVALPSPAGHEPHGEVSWGSDASAWRYCGYAAAALALTVLVGSWLRIAMLYPPALGGVEFRHGVHAHSHVALFGWTTMALFALVLRAGGIARPWTRWHAHAVGLASLAAFAGFLQVGYAAATIAIAMTHVALWIGFAAAAWRPLAAARPLVRRHLRAALLLLVLAGVGAVMPGMVRALGADDPWLSRFAVELFLTPFLEGWLGLGIAAALYGQVEQPRYGTPVLWLLACCAFPASLLRVGVPPPVELLSSIGRLGSLGLGLGALLLALDACRTPRLAPLLRLATAALVLKGVTDVGVALGGGLELLANSQLKIAYLHLVLLGGVTPVLLASVAAPAVRAPSLALLHAAGLLATLGSVTALGIPRATEGAVALGLSARSLLATASLGGILSAVSVLGILWLNWRKRHEFSLRGAQSVRVVPSTYRTGSVVPSRVKS